MASPVTGQRLGEPSQHQVAVGLEDHVDEIDDDHAADVAQPHLAHDLLGRFEVVPGHRLLEVATRTGELARVDVDDRHRLGVLDDQRATRRQPHLAVERLRQLLVDAVHHKGIRRIGVRFLELLNAIHQVGRDGADVPLDEVPCLGTLDDEFLEVLVEQVTHHPNQQVWFLVERLWPGRTGVLLGLGDRFVDRTPLGFQTRDVGAEFLSADTLGRGPDDDAGVGRHELGQDLLEAFAFDVGQLAADSGRRTAGHVHEITAGQRDLRGQTRTLVAHRVLADLDEHIVAGFEGLLDLA